MPEAPNTPRPGSPMPSLAAPMMSASSSTASHNTKMWSAEASRRGSNASSVTPNAETLDTKKTTVTAATTTSEPAPRPCRVRVEDPMTRVYPKPEGKLDLTEALAREPLPRSINHWRKYARDARVVKLSSEETKKRFQDTKDDLMRSFVSMQTPKK